MMNFNKKILFLFVATAWSAQASVVPEYAENTYTEHTLTRSEQKCIDEGYKITYANCSNQTAPADRCPHHDAYYRSCSQEQWCRNNNFNFLKEDCKLPSYPVKICDNQYQMYRACQEDTDKACREAGFSSKDDCQLTDKRCSYNNDYGKCCNECTDFAYELDKIPEGYVADGETCTTCGGIVKTNVVEAPCEDYMPCEFGPLSLQTPSCKKGKETLYSACKTADMACKEKGFTQSNCRTSEDEETCPEFKSLKKCRVNCYKLAVETFPEADVMNENMTDPRLELTKTQIKSLYGKISSECESNFRPEITLNINEKNLELYEHVFDRDISNVNFIINFEKKTPLTINGTLNNVKIKVMGDVPNCPLKGKSVSISGTVSLVDVADICANINIADNSKFITTGNVQGNIDLGKDASLGIKGNLNGYLKTKAFAEIFVKGTLTYADSANRTAEDGGIIFGCDSRSKILGGIVANPANIIVKQRALIDTPSIKMVSESNNPDMSGLLSSLHLHKFSKLLTTYDTTEYPLIDNSETGCDDKYVIHLGSSTNENEKSLSLEPANLLEDKWQCRSLSRAQLECN